MVKVDTNTQPLALQTTVAPLPRQPVQTVVGPSVTVSTQPTLTRSQEDRARRSNQPAPHSAVQVFERHYPEFKRIRQQAARLARRQQDGGPPLHPLEFNKRRMLLEGQLLQLSPGLSFQDLNPLLNLDQPHSLPAVIPYGDTFTSLVDQVEAHFDHAALPSLDTLRAVLDEALPRIAKHLDGHAALYEEVLANTLLDEQERPLIHAGRKALEGLAEHWSGAIQTRLLEHCLSTATEKLASANEDLATLSALPEQAPDRAGQLRDAEANQQQWQHIQSYFDEAARSFQKDGPLKDSLDNLHLEAHLDSLDAQNSGLFTHARVFMGSAVPQGLASMLQFVLARAYIEPELSVRGFAANVAGSGASIGAVHETLDNFLKPAAKEVMASLGAPDLRKVDAEEAIPNPTRATTRGGEYHEYTPEERDAALTDVADARKGFINAQQDFYNGTLKGDSITFGAQGGAQMARKLIDLTAPVNAAGLAARMVSSFVGGAVMSGTQSVGQQNKTFEHQGRNLPTHVPEIPSATLGTRLGNVLSKGASSVDPRENKAREGYASKVYSATQGMSAYSGVGVLMNKLDTETAAGKAGSVLLTGVQAVGLLAPFYANKQSRDEAKLDGTSRFASAVENVRNPDREVLPHGTRPDSWARPFENTYNRLRGLEQAAPQAGTEVTEAVLGSMVNGLTALGSRVGAQIASQTARFRHREAPVDIEMGLQRPVDQGVGEG